MKAIKIIVISIVAIVVLIFIVLLIVSRIYEGDFFFLAPSYRKVDRFTIANINELSYVANALSELDYDSIVIRKEPLDEKGKYNMTVSHEYLVYETISIPSELVGHIQNLYENGVEVISCGNDSVNFTIWSIMDESRGIIFTKSGKKPDGEQLYEVRELSTENWYYYVHNYEKAKEKNPGIFK